MHIKCNSQLFLEVNTPQLPNRRVARIVQNLHPCGYRIWNKSGKYGVSPFYGGSPYQFGYFKILGDMDPLKTSELDGVKLYELIKMRCRRHHSHNIQNCLSGKCTTGYGVLCLKTISVIHQHLLTVLPENY